MHGFLNWLAWCSTPCIEDIQWSQSRNRHNRKVQGAYFLNMVFIRSFLTRLTSWETLYFPSQLKLARTSLGVTGNKIELFCGKYNSKYGKSGLIKLPMWKIPPCSSHFFKKNICCFIMAFTLDHVKNLIESNSVYELRNAESVIFDRLKKSPRFTQTKLYESLTVTGWPALLETPGTSWKWITLLENSKNKKNSWKCSGFIFFHCTLVILVVS